MEHLPSELINLIIFKLKSPRDIHFICVTCKAINKVHNWKTICDYHYANTVYEELIDELNYRASYNVCTEALNLVCWMISNKVEYYGNDADIILDDIYQSDDVKKFGIIEFLGDCELITIGNIDIIPSVASLFTNIRGLIFLPSCDKIPNEFPDNFNKITWCNYRSCLPFADTFKVFPDVKHVSIIMLPDQFIEFEEKIRNMDFEMDIMIGDFLRTDGEKALIIQRIDR